MTLDALLLQKLADWRPHQARQTLTVDEPDSGWRAEVAADAVETLGIRLWEVTLRRISPLDNPASLADQASRIADRVTGLLEPLRLVEIDTQRNTAQLRSESPAQDGDTLNYYEVIRHLDGTTEVSRFQASRTSPGRQAVAFTLTHEALAKLVRDLIA